MYIKDDYDFHDLENKCWQGAISTLEMISDNDKEDELMAFLEEYFGDTPTITEVNDLLWFDEDYIKEELGITDWSKLEELVDSNLVEKVAKEVKSEMDDLEVDDPNREDYEQVLQALDFLEGEVNLAVKSEEISDDLDLIVGTLTGQIAWMIENKKFESMMGEISDWIDKAIRR